ncbi:MAG: GNAT family N-acetyltransferase [Candidatus Binatia bacterium]
MVAVMHAAVALPHRVRPAIAADAPVVAHHRVAMFVDMGQLAPADAAALYTASLAHLGPALASATYRGWLLEIDGAVVAGAGVVCRPLLPRPEHLAGGEEAYVLNVYTEPAFRGRGLARDLMNVILAWCGERGIARVALHASAAGRPLYRQLGFQSTNEMCTGL